MSLFRTLSLRYLWKHWVRAVLIVVSIALGVAAWVATDALHRALNHSLRQAAAPLRGPADLYVSNSASLFVDASLAEPLRRLPGVKRVTPIIIEHVRISRQENGSEKSAAAEEEVVLIGVPWPRPDTADEKDLSARGIQVSGVDWQSARNYAVAKIWHYLPVLVGQQLDESFLHKKSFVIRIRGKDHTALPIGQVQARGAAATLGGHVILAEWQEIAALLGRPGQVNRLDVALEDDADRDEAKRRISAAVADRGEVQTPQDQDQRLHEVTRGMEVGFKLCGAGALVVGLFLVYNALSVTVRERRHDIGIMRSLGATRAQVRLLFLGEALLLGLAGAAVGLPLGLGIARLALGPVQEVLKGVYLPLQVRELETTPLLLFQAALGGLATALLAALIPASHAAAEEPADAVRRAPLAHGLGYRLLQIGTSALLVVVGCLLMAVRHQRQEAGLGSVGEGAFVIVALIFLGVLLAGPLLTALVARLVVQPLARQFLPVSSRLAADNLVRSPGRTGLVIVALAAGIALMVQTAGMIRSNEDAFLSWVSRSVRADLYVTSGGPISASGQTRPLKEGVAADIQKELPAGSELVGLSFRYIDWEPHNRLTAGSAAVGPTTVVYMVLTDARKYYEANRDRPEPPPNLDLWKQLGERPGLAMVSENFARMHRVKVGDFIQLKGRKGLVRFQVVGTPVDYSWIRGTIFIDRQHHREAFGADEVNAWEVYLPPGSEVEPAREKLLRSRVTTRHALTTLTRQEVHDGWASLVRRIYGVAYTQEVVVAIVAVFGVVTSLLISVLARRRELGLLRAVGGTRTQLLQTVMAEAVFIGLVGTVLGVLLGLPMEWYMVRVVLFEETGFLFPMRIPWAEAGIIAGLAVLSAALAGLGPALQAMRLRIADAVAYE